MRSVMSRERLLLNGLFFLAWITISYAQSHFIPLPNATCPFGYGQDTGLFYSQPQVGSSSVCVSKNNHICCTKNYTDKILQKTDSISSQLSIFFANVTDDCEAELDILRCIPCEYDSFVWTVRLSSLWNEVKLCDAYCQTLFKSCEGSKLNSNGRMVNETYPLANLFCTVLFTGTTTTNTNVLTSISGSSEISCFNPHNKECTVDDITYYYTDCDTDTNTRDLYYSWKTGITCNGGVKLPDTVSDLKCPINCPEGQYLPLGEESCQICPAGTFSLGGGHRVHEWNEWPTRFIVFKTYCLTGDGEPFNNNCSGWKLQGNYVESNIARKSYTQSVLETEVMIHHNGSVSFVCQVDAEYAYDKFLFYIGDTRYSIPTSMDAKKYTFPISAGYHKLQWVYSKDRTVDYGLDYSLIYEIEIGPMSEHSDYCISCLPGTISNSNATDCFDCPRNFYNNQSGSSECLSCSEHEYSFSGDSECKTRLPCVASDAQSLYTECSLSHIRTLYYVWMEPKICDNSTADSYQLLGPSKNEACSPCNPGHYRSGRSCYLCKEGQWSQVGTEFNCSVCPEGKFAPIQLRLSVFDEWPNNSSTSCSGSCGTDGWRLRSGYLDSGDDHGSHANVFFNLDVWIESEEAGTVQYDFTLSCTGWCYLELYDGTHYIHSDWNSVFSPNESFTVGPLYLSRGIHNLAWSFGKFFNQRNNDRAILKNIIIDGVKSGGAGECISCPAGTFTNKTSGSSSCIECPPGYSSDVGATSCTPCPANTHNPDFGGICLPCGTGLEIPPGSTACEGYCQFKSGDDFYDFTPMARKPYDPMWGPVQEDHPLHLYYVNPCVKQTSNFTCYDQHGNGIVTYACQYVSDYGYSMDLGPNMNITPLEGDTKGVVMVFYGGTPGCGDWMTGTVDVPRRLSLTISCDPEKGLGTLEKPISKPIYDYEHNVYPDVCKYDLLWRSVYGCPICTENDYVKIYENCEDGLQNIRYDWKTNPKSCHGGVPLPSSFIRTCTYGKTCSVGYRLADLSDDCVPCDMNQFSLGNGAVYSNWEDHVHFPFMNAGWMVEDGMLRTYEDSSILALEKNFGVAAENLSVTFTYKYVAQGVPFSFWIDSKQYDLTEDTPQGWKTVVYPVAPGTHIFKWNYQQRKPKYSVNREGFVKIEEIRLIGTENDDCHDCQTGFINNLDKSACVPCPADSIQVGNYCVNCNADDFRDPGQGNKCQRRPNCTIEDFEEDFPPIVRCGSVAPLPIKSFFKKSPTSVCVGEIPAEREITKCIPCPWGYIYNQERNDCIPCPAKTYHVGMECKAVQSGYTSVLISRFFHPDDFITELPKAFTFSCDGIFACTGGSWRITDGTYISSGTHFGEVDVSATLNFRSDPNYFATPQVNFTMTIYPDPHFVNTRKRADDPISDETGIEFYIDGEIQDFAFRHPPGKSAQGNFFVTKNVEEHELKWVYVQGSRSPPNFVSLSSLSITGTADGTNIHQIACPPGTAEINGYCVKCPAGTHNSVPGVTQCKICPTGQISEKGSSDCQKCGTGTVSRNNTCESTCSFTASNDIKYDLTPLISESFSVLPDPGTSWTSFQISPCTRIFPNNCPKNHSICSIEKGYIFGELLTDNSNIVKTLGTFVEFKEKNKKEGKSLNTFNLEFKNGINLPTGCKTVNTTIKFYCSVSEGKGNLKAIDLHNPCHLVFQWESVYGCRQCNADDVVEELGTCVNGERQVIYTYLNPCHGSSLTAQKTPCESIEFQKTTVALGALMGAVLGLLATALAFYFYQKKRIMEAKYAVLQNEVNLEDGDL